MVDMKCLPSWKLYAAVADPPHCLTGLVVIKGALAVQAPMAGGVS